ncbi:MAG: DUF1189 domain-containing protein [Clostridiales bacterium]|jgi:hypothetical protein|nr:DUF1189 domain-containing protein [Clostridiales bacterium]
MKRKYGLFARFRDCVISPDIAEYAVEKGGGNAIGYLAILCLLVTLVYVAVLFTQAYLQGGIKTALETFPEFSLSGGKLYMDIDEPIVFNDAGSLFIVENSDSTALLEKNKDSALQLTFLNQDIFYTKVSLNEVRYRWSDLGFEINSEQLRAGIYNWGWVIIIVTGIFTYIGDFLYGLFFSVLVTGTGLGLNITLRTKLRYSQLYALAIYALTAKKLFDAVLTVLSAFTAISFHLPAFIAFLATSGFMLWYLLSIKRNKDGKIFTDNNYYDY